MAVAELAVQGRPRARFGTMTAGLANGKAPELANGTAHGAFYRPADSPLCQQLAAWATERRVCRDSAQVVLPLVVDRPS